MTPLQADDVLRHTFRQLDKMLKDVHRQETASRSTPPGQERKPVDKTSGSGKPKK